MTRRPKTQRETIPKAIRESLLKEFNGRCALCGTDRPHIHHIDEDPSNNDPLNLLPLCPNCHLTDQHNPTTTIDRDRLRLFRDHKDPAILHERFEPLWHRCAFLTWFGQETTFSVEELTRFVSELLSFVRALNMGAFYSEAIGVLTQCPPNEHPMSVLGDPNSERERKKAWEELAQAYRAKLVSNAYQILSLVVEMLRYQDWPERRARNRYLQKAETS